MYEGVGLCILPKLLKGRAPIAGTRSSRPVGRGSPSRQSSGRSTAVGLSRPSAGHTSEVRRSGIVISGRASKERGHADILAVLPVTDVMVTVVLSLWHMRTGQVGPKRHHRHTAHLHRLTTIPHHRHYHSLTPTSPPATSPPAASLPATPAYYQPRHTSAGSDTR